MRHNDDLHPFIRSYDVKSLQSVLYSVVEGKTEEAYVIVRNSRNYPSLKKMRICKIVLTLYCLACHRGNVKPNILILNYKGSSKEFPMSVATMSR